MFPWRTNSATWGWSSICLSGSGEVGLWLGVTNHTVSIKPPPALPLLSSIQARILKYWFCHLLHWPLRPGSKWWFYANSILKEVQRIPYGVYGLLYRKHASYIPNTKAPLWSLNVWETNIKWDLCLFNCIDLNLYFSRCLTCVKIVLSVSFM